ncbi:MAG: hypothetical protein WCE90_03675 [Candidatus Zixiibacteriota bacterium]
MNETSNQVRKSFWEKLLSIDRRIIFLFVTAAIVVPLFFTVSMPIPVTPVVQAVYDSIDNLPAGSKVLVSLDFDPASMPELQPMADAFLRQCFRKGLKVIIMGLWPQGPLQANISLEKVLRDPEIKAKNLQYGIDYVNLGYTAGNEVVIDRMGHSFEESYPKDSHGTPLAELPLMQGVKNYDNIDLIFNLSAGYPGTMEWVQYAVDVFHVKLAAGNTAVQAPSMYPYIQSKQLVGVLGGMKGGAEYEMAIGKPDKAVGYMFSQAVSHAVICVFIIIGNVAFFSLRKKKTA